MPKPDLEVLERQASAIITQLFSEIKGSPPSSIRSGSAAWALYRVLSDACDHLAGLALQNPDYLSKVAESCPAWPSLISPHPVLMGRNQEIIKTLRVGSKHPFALEKPEGARRQWNPETPVNKVAIGLIQELDIRRSFYRSRPKGQAGNDTQKIKDAIIALPNYSSQTYEKWLDVAWLVVMNETGGKPENNPALAQIGEYRRHHSEHVGAQKKATKATENSNVRDGLKERLRQAFKTIAKDPLLQSSRVDQTGP